MRTSSTQGLYHAWVERWPLKWTGGRGAWLWRIVVFTIMSFKLNSIGSSTDPHTSLLITESDKERSIVGRTCCTILEKCPVELVRMCYTWPPDPLADFSWCPGMILQLQHATTTSNRLAACSRWGYRKDWCMGGLTAPCPLKYAIIWVQQLSLAQMAASLL